MMAPHSEFTFTGELALEPRPETNSQTLHPQNFS